MSGTTLRTRGAIFRATVRRLARELAEDTRRRMEAAMN